MKKNILLLFLIIGNIIYTQSTESLSQKTDLIIFSFNRPLQLYTLLESISLYTTNINSIITIYRSSNARYDAAFTHVASCFPHVTFLRQHNIYDFKTLTIHALENTSSPYIVFAVDDNIVKDTINMHECINYLEQTKAYGFYLKLGLHLDYCYTENSPQAVPPYEKINHTIYSWHFELGEKDWHYPNTVDMTLYRKKDIMDVLKLLEYNNPNTLEGKWAAWWVEHKAPSPIGLFYENSKIINIPLNKVQTINILNRDMNLYTPEELLQKFEEGYKIDIQPLYQMKNNAVHTEYEPLFIKK